MQGDEYFWWPVCLTRASWCRTLVVTAMDSFAVNQHNCTGRATGPIQRVGNRRAAPTISQNSGQPFASGLLPGIKGQIDDRPLRPRTEAPSIRTLWKLTFQPFHSGRAYSLSPR
jgi:hypothetical protein